MSGQPWASRGALKGQMQPLQYAAGVVEPALGAAAGLAMWFVGVATVGFAKGLDDGGGYFELTKQKNDPETPLFIKSK